MEPTNPQPPMLAKETQGAGSPTSSQRSESGHRDEPKLASHADPDRVAEQVLAHLEEGLYLAARGLAKEAAARFPDHARLQKLWWFFDNRGKSRLSSLPPGPGRKREFEWLRHPPEWARGKWVALVGSEAVAVGDTLKEVTESARSQELSRRPLVHRID